MVVLCPTTIAALYWKKATKWGCISSILAGEFSIFIFELEFVHTFGFLSAVWVILVSILVLIIVSYIKKIRMLYFFYNCKIIINKLS
ncbi:MAG: hypothetical protein KAJ21_00240 [Thermoplasmatales archaeon]|nr:hypothetical protein [Thermoplasmatales archaeon]